MKRTILVLICGAVLLFGLSPVPVMAARKGQGKRSPEVQQLRKEMQAFHSEVQAAKAKGPLSPEDKAKFQAERQRLNKEAKELGLNKNGKGRSKNRGGSPAGPVAPTAL